MKRKRNREKETNKLLFLFCFLCSSSSVYHTVFISNKEVLMYVLKTKSKMRFLPSFVRLIESVRSIVRSFDRSIFRWQLSLHIYMKKRRRKDKRNDVYMTDVCTSISASFVGSFHNTYVYIASLNFEVNGR